MNNQKVRPALSAIFLNLFNNLTSMYQEVWQGRPSASPAEVGVQRGVC
jgi:hypothetical protein